MEDLLARIQSLHLIEEGDRCVLGLSGGPDSMALACLLVDLNQDLDFDLVFCHVHHGLRGGEADRDLAFVRDWALKKGYPFIWGYVNMPAYAREKGLSEEEAGRILRHNFLRAQAGPRGKVVLAHNYEDQAETILHRILRGTGPDGLQGMTMKEGPLIRPLLKTRRREIIAYLENLGQDYCLDSTNIQDDYTRNYLRHQVLPRMKEVNPKAKEALVRLGDLSSLDRLYFTKKVDQIFQERVRIDFGAAQVAVKDLRDLDPALRYRLYRKIFEDLAKTGLKNLSYGHLKDLDRCLDFPSGKGLDLVGLRVERAYEDLIFYEKGQKLRPMTLKLGENRGDFGVYQVYLTRKPGEEGLVLDEGENLTIRSREPGDRIEVNGKNLKVKDLLQDRKVPKPFRDQVEVLVGKEIYALGQKKSDHWTREGKRLVVRKEKTCATN